jgi:serine/threonine protein kinase
MEKFQYSLKEILENRIITLSNKEKLKILRSVIEGLKIIHSNYGEQKVNHNDVSTSNVLLDID